MKTWADAPPPPPLKKSPEQIIAYIVRQMCAFFLKYCYG